MCGLSDKCRASASLPRSNLATRTAPWGWCVCSIGGAHCRLLPPWAQARAGRLGDPGTHRPGKFCRRESRQHHPSIHRQLRWMLAAFSSCQFRRDPQGRRPAIFGYSHKAVLLPSWIGSHGRGPEFVFGLLITLVLPKHRGAVVLDGPDLDLRRRPASPPALCTVPA